MTKYMSAVTAQMGDSGQDNRPRELRYELTNNTGCKKASDGDWADIEEAILEE